MQTLSRSNFVDLLVQRNRDHGCRCADGAARWQFVGSAALDEVQRAYHRGDVRGSVDRQLGGSVWSHQEWCEQPVKLECVVCDGTVISRCNRTKARACAPCARRYRLTVKECAERPITERRFEVAADGSIDETRVSVLSEPIISTVEAEQPAHTAFDRPWLLNGTYEGALCDVRSDGFVMTITAPGKRGIHRRPVWTYYVVGGKVHRAQTGTAVCKCSKDAGDLGDWNATSGARFNRFMQAVRRELGEDVAVLKKDGTPSSRTKREALKFPYLRAVEAQKRGALHDHVIGIHPTDRFRLTPEILHRLEALARQHGYGHAFDLQPLSASGVAGYVAKAVGTMMSDYISKSADADDVSIPFRRARRAVAAISAGRILRAIEERKAWDAARARIFAEIAAGIPQPLALGAGIEKRVAGVHYDRRTWRTWTKSQNWGQCRHNPEQRATMKLLRAERVCRARAAAASARAARGLVPLSGCYTANLDWDQFMTALLALDGDLEGLLRVLARREAPDNSESLQADGA